MGSEQQFCLRWNNFQNSLLASLPQLLDTNDLTDVTLCAGGKSIRAHRVVLSACSQYFKQLFREMQPFYHPVIVLPQTSYSDVCALVSFMYSGEVNIYQEQLPSLLAAAAALHIRGLAEVPHAHAHGKGCDKPEMELHSPKRPRLDKLDLTPPEQSPLSNPLNTSTPLRPALDLLFPSQSPERYATKTEPSEPSSTEPLLDTNCSHDEPLALSTDNNNHGPLTSDESPGSDMDLQERLLQAVQQGLSPTLPLNFLQSGPLFSPFNTMSRNKLFATCHICGKSLSNQYNLRVHLETHQNLNYSCSLCSHVSRSRDALRKHIAYKHTEGKYSTRIKTTSSSLSSSPEEEKVVVANAAT
ncbi:protein bric-a-brac 2-like isoform X1 [Neocloeon triangulifer]|uniref:protein bric-a-brac 2-like isoform X1 n=1 Tax=Neocloeon triangulifer TaxID=2078957 RepID=UPI00286F120A|nr:protein bric-a-brac 2-like isoform X1 [Neocloeon triangulifer]XP_059479960.1 protein bric-a-brac 2-like isoform X1 [Neocloeon triangulifer]